MPRLTTADGRALAWRERGSGPPLLCHPGGPGFAAASFGDLRELAEERTLIVLDPRGTGESDPPADPAGYELAQYADDIEALRERLGLERADLLGHSHGGFVAMTWAGTHPERVGRLVLASTTPRFTDAIRRARRERVLAHSGRPYFADAVAALEQQQAGGYSTDAELGALYERATPVLSPPGAAVPEVAETLRSAGINAVALKHFNERIAGKMDLRLTAGARHRAGARADGRARPARRAGRRRARRRAARRHRGRRARRRPLPVPRARSARPVVARGARVPRGLSRAQPGSRSRVSHHSRP